LRDGVAVAVKESH